MVFVLVSKSRKVVPDELVTLMSWDSRDFLTFLVMVVWKRKDVVIKCDDSEQFKVVVELSTTFLSKVTCIFNRRITAYDPPIFDGPS